MRRWETVLGHSRWARAAFRNERMRRVNGQAFSELVLVDRNPLHVTMLSKVVIDCVVLRGAVVPDTHGVLLPTIPASEFWTARVQPEFFEQRQALCFTHTHKSRRERAIDVQHLAACLRMDANNRMSILYHFYVGKLVVGACEGSISIGRNVVARH